MKKSFKTERINYFRGLSWRVEVSFWTNRNCFFCEKLNEDNPVENRLFYTYSIREFRKHTKAHNARGHK